MSKLYALVLVSISLLFNSCTNSIENIYNISLLPSTKKLTIANKLDSENYTRLAGIYVDDSNHFDLNDIYLFSKNQFSWGNDYSLGKYSTIIEYGENKWSKSEGGIVDYFNITNSTKDSITIDFGENYEPREQLIKFTGDNVQINNYNYVKIGGPDKQMQFIGHLLALKRVDLSFVNNQSLRDENINQNEIKKISTQVFYLLKNANYEGLCKVSSSKYGVRFGSQNDLVEFSSIIGNSNEYKKKVDYEQLTLSSIETIKWKEILINKFKYISAQYLFTHYNNPLVIEFVESRYCYYAMVFVNENNSLKLVEIDNRIDME